MGNGEAMVRNPLTPEQIESGQRLGRFLRAARGRRGLGEVAAAAGISPETLRKIETGRLPSPAFGTVVGLAEAIGVDLDALAAVWKGLAGVGAGTGRGRS